MLENEYRPESETKAPKNEDRELEKRFAATDPSDGPDVVFQERPWIPRGKYEFTFADKQLLTMKWGPKLLLHLRVAAGEYEGVMLTRFYNVDDFDDRGRPQIASARHFKQEMKILFPGRSLRDFAWKWLTDVLITAYVEDTGTNGERYSKVAEIIGGRPR